MPKGENLNFGESEGSRSGARRGKNIPAKQTCRRSWWDWKCFAMSAFALAVLWMLSRNGFRSAIGFASNNFCFMSVLHL